jgi:hypothetical protein
MKIEGVNEWKMKLAYRKRKVKSKARDGVEDLSRDVNQTWCECKRGCQVASSGE